MASINANKSVRRLTPRWITRPEEPEKPDEIAYIQKFHLPYTRQQIRNAIESDFPAYFADFLHLKLQWEVKGQCEQPLCVGDKIKGIHIKGPLGFGRRERFSATISHVDQDEIVIVEEYAKSSQFDHIQQIIVLDVEGEDEIGAIVTNRATQDHRHIKEGFWLARIGYRIAPGLMYLWQHNLDASRMKRTLKRLVKRIHLAE